VCHVTGNSGGDLTDCRSARHWGVNYTAELMKCACLWTEPLQLRDGRISGALPERYDLAARGWSLLVSLVTCKCCVHRVLSGV